jgi:hypothetical protein
MKKLRIVRAPVAEKEPPMVTRTQQLEALAKQQGVGSISKAIIEEPDKLEETCTGRQRNNTKIATPE